MNIVYTILPRVPEGDFACRNPRYFQGVEKDAENVLVMGSWPHVVAAYEAVEATVESISEAEFLAAAVEPAEGRLPEDQQREMLIDELLERGIHFDDSMGIDELRSMTITQPDGLVNAETSDSIEPAEHESTDPADERKALVAELKQKNISFAKNAPTEKLRELLHASAAE